MNREYLQQDPQFEDILSRWHYRGLNPGEFVVGNVKWEMGETVEALHQLEQDLETSSIAIIASHHARIDLGLLALKLSYLAKLQSQTRINLEEEPEPLVTQAHFPIAEQAWLQPQFQDHLLQLQAAFPFVTYYPVYRPYEEYIDRRDYQAGRLQQLIGDTNINDYVDQRRLHLNDAYMKALRPPKDLQTQAGQLFCVAAAAGITPPGENPINDGVSALLLADRPIYLATVRYLPEKGSLYHQVRIRRAEFVSFAEAKSAHGGSLRVKTWLEQTTPQLTDQLNQLEGQRPEHDPFLWVVNTLSNYYQQIDTSDWRSHLAQLKHLQANGSR